MVRRMSVSLPHVDSFTDRHGHVRVYFRRGRGKRIALPALSSPAFMQAYHAALGSAPARKTAKPRDGTVAALLASYYASPAFLRNKPKTRAMTRRYLDPFGSAHGHRLVAQMPRDKIEAMIGAKWETPGAANNFLKKLRALMGFAIANDWIKSDPTLKIKRFKEGTHHTWTEDEIATFERRWPPGSRERTAFALALYTGQRRADLAAMTWRQYDPAGVIEVAQIKRDMEAADERLMIPVHRNLREALSRWPRRHMVILSADRPRGMSPNSLGMFMSKAIGAAGLPDRCVLHGLRKAAARRLAEAGCSAKEIASITGHKSLDEVERYTRAADQVRLARSAVTRLEEQR